jgi:hypothetical protein
MERRFGISNGRSGMGRQEPFPNGENGPGITKIIMRIPSAPPKEKALFPSAGTITADRAYSRLREW